MSGAETALSFSVHRRQGGESTELNLTRLLPMHVVNPA
jgi:hypothetical protein